jgi:general secretion pathway protein J
MISNRNSLGQQSGFTLLELLVALLVLGLLVVGLAQGVRAGLTMWGAQTRRLSETAELDAGARVLRMLLTNMTALSPGNVGTGAAAPNAATPNAAIPNIEASSDKLTFVGDLPTGLGTTRRANITLELDQERLVLRWTPHRHERTTAPEPEPIEIELIRGVERLEFAYWGAGSPDQPAGWQDQSGSSQLPELIRVRLTFSKGDRRRWPDLIVAPSVSASPQATGQLQRQR